jgi:hypothetical protein
MKSRSKELLDRAVAAMIAAIEVYNKPSFPYRAETFAILAINSWELLFKAKWLSDNGNKERSLFVFEVRTNATGEKSKKQYVKTTRSGNPFTHSADYLGKKLVEQKKLDPRAWDNVEALMELRDCSIHFFNSSPAFAVRLQEVGTASLKNFVAVIQEWFGRDLGGFNLYLMPLSFVEVPRDTSGILLNAREQNYVAFLESLEKPNAAPNSPYSVTVNIEVKFTRSKAKDALSVQVTKDPNAPAVRLTEEQVRERYPWDYEALTKECQKRYAGFKIDQRYHVLRKRLLGDARFGMTRYLDPGNPKSSKKPFFNPNILGEFDKAYRRTSEENF